MIATIGLHNEQNQTVGVSALWVRSSSCYVKSLVYLVEWNQILDCEDQNDDNNKLRIGQWL